jgi:hypothetical protein
MSRISGRVRVCAVAATAATAATLVAVVPSGGAAAAARPAVRHSSLQASVQRLPNYFPGIVHWKLSTSSRHYGTTDWVTNTITISAFTPVNLLYSVIAHEWSHEIQAFVYHRDFWGIVRSMNRHFGGGGSSGQRGVEYAADCMARLMGATWTDYTSCQNRKWRHSAKRLLKGHALKARHHHHKARGTTTPPAPARPKPTSTEPTHELTTDDPTKPTWYNTQASPAPAPASTPEPYRYPRPDQYTISWQPTWGR